MPTEKKNKLTIFLIKQGITNHASILDNYNTLNSKNMRGDNDDIVGVLYFPKSIFYPPDWLENFFETADLGVIFQNSNTRAVYIIEVSGRLFVLTFGYGKSILKKDVYEDDFGLYTTLNLVIPDTLRSIDKTDLALSGKKSKENLTRSGTMMDFGIDAEQDLINEVTGKSKDLRLGNIITGRESFHTKIAVNYRNVHEFLKDFLDYYKKDDYKVNFGWVDNVKSVMNRILINELNEDLIERIISGNYEDIWLSVPQVINWSNIEGFKYGKSIPKGNRVYDDLGLVDFKNIFSKEFKKIDTDSLKKKFHVFCGYDFKGSKWDKWSIFECLYCELDYNNESYVLSNGRWYKVKTDFVVDINARFESMPNIESGLPVFDEAKYKGKGSNKGEAGYNSDVANSDDDLILFDSKNINIGGGRNKIEFCDLFRKSDKSLIHVKRYGASNVFSHLFNQGLVSGELLVSERKFREEVNNRLSDDCKFVNLDAKPNAGDYKIIFAVVSHLEGQLHLPFFSRISLINVCRRLQSMGFNVYKAKIQKL